MNKLELREELLLKIMKLSQNIWEHRVKEEHIDKWLSNFTEDDDLAKCESSHALFLLSNFMFFGVREIRELLKSLYRDKVKIPLIQDIRKSLGDTKDANSIYKEFYQGISETRFLGMGNPSESGNHLLYFFRQENDLPKEFFIHTHEIISIERDAQSVTKLKLKNENIKRYVFIDDVCGSGTQATEYSEDLVKEIKALNPDIEVNYFTLFSTSHGLKNIKDNTLFDGVDCVFELDDSFKCFSDNSRVFKGVGKLPLSKEFTELFCKKYGKFLVGEDHALGYKDGQMLMGFAHNVPDNTLPIIWNEASQWEPILKRYSKLFANLYN
jgi:hypothetical protein